MLGSVGDPVGDGIIKSLARPGGNVTGTSLQLFELGVKQIELVAEMLPRMRRPAVLTHVSQVKTARDRYELVTRNAAAAKGLSLGVHQASGAASIGLTFQALAAEQADAVLINPSPQLNALRSEICRRAIDSRLPTVSFVEEWAQDGALMSFGPSWTTAYRRAAYFVDRILKGAKPADLPVEQPTKFDLVVNAKTARTLGVKIPHTVLVRADRVIE